ncbi:MAG: carboxymuconolactone decarboxylase family protein [Spirochaetes bacterium]|nr:carboxymuconolactone decarboxylase family protein [Spirochaetota bacterium]
MDTQRIQPLPLPLSAEMQETMDRIFPKGLPSPVLYRTVARNEGLFRDMVERRFIGPTGLFDRKTLPRRLRELIILRTCVAAGNDYEFRLHVETISLAMGLTAAQIADISRRRPNEALWNPGEPEVMRLIDGLVASLEVSDTLFADLRGHFDEPTLIEITNLIGLYTGVAMIVAMARPAFDNYGALLGRGKAEAPGSGRGNEPQKGDITNEGSTS